MSFTSDFLPFLEFDFLKRAFVASIVLSLSAAPLGVFLILKRLSLVGDALSHSILPGVALGYFLYGLSLPAMTVGGLVAGVAVILISNWVTSKTHLKEETSFATFYLISLSLGVLLISAKGSQMDLVHVLFGNLLSIDSQTLILLGAVSSITILFVAIFYRALVLEAFDPEFFQLKAGPGSLSSKWLPQFFLGLIVLNLVSSFHAIGTLLSLGLIILPAATASLWVKSIPRLIGLSLLISFISSYLGILISFHFDFAIGPTIVLFIGMIYVFSLLFRNQKKSSRKPRPQLEKT